MVKRALQSVNNKKGRQDLGGLFLIPALSAETNRFKGGIVLYYTAYGIVCQCRIRWF